jgi:hypothetical protein
VADEHPLWSGQIDKGEISRSKRVAVRLLGADWPHFVQQDLGCRRRIASADVEYVIRHLVTVEAILDDGSWRHGGLVNTVPGGKRADLLLVTVVSATPETAPAFRAMVRKPVGYCVRPARRSTTGSSRTRMPGFAGPGVALDYRGCAGKFRLRLRVSQKKGGWIETFRSTVTEPQQEQTLMDRFPRSRFR